jgi:hypothetical protein
MSSLKSQKYTHLDSCIIGKTFSDVCRTVSPNGQASDAHAGADLASASRYLASMTPGRFISSAIALPAKAIPRA